MLKTDEISDIVFEAAAAHMASGQLRRVIIEPFVNFADQDGLRVTAVLSGAYPSALSGATAMNVLLAVSDRLFEAGEPRVPTVSFATEEELAHSGDPDT